MSCRKAFTLIELIIVILIIAILAGGALPFLQQYVEDSRFSKAKQDLDEIKNALMRYENDQGILYPHSDLRALVGPYLTKGMTDPWGHPYVVAPASSSCYSLGPDHLENTGDEIKQYFRPPLSIARAFWEDINKNATVDTGDVLMLRFTRPLRDEALDGPQTDITQDDFIYSNYPPDLDYTNLAFFDNRMTVRLTINYTPGLPTFRPTADTIAVKNNSSIVDGEGTACIAEMPIVIKAP